MNKAELVNAIASKTNVSKKLADAVMNAMTETIVETARKLHCRLTAVSNAASASGDDGTGLVGFGSFEPRTRSAREGRNPKTGKTIQIPAATVPCFSAGKQFKEAVKV